MPFGQGRGWQRAIIANKVAMRREGNTVFQYVHGQTCSQDLPGHPTHPTHPDICDRNSAHGFRDPRRL
jgi:hypothetical protein